MIAAIGQILIWVGRLFPWIIRAAPWLLTIFNVLLSFWPAAQQWVANLAGAALPTVLGIAPMNLADLPSVYLTQINTFVPLDLMVTSFALYLPFYLSCLAQRIARATILAKRS